MLRFTDWHHEWYAVSLLLYPGGQSSWGLRGTREAVTLDMALGSRACTKDPKTACTKIASFCEAQSSPCKRCPSETLSVSQYKSMFSKGEYTQDDGGNLRGSTKWSLLSSSIRYLQPRLKAVRSNNHIQTHKFRSSVHGQPHTSLIRQRQNFN